MDGFEYQDALTGATVIQDGATGHLSVRHAHDALPKCTSLFFPGCSMINYAMPLVSAVYSTLQEAGEADGISMLCCGKILSYEPNGDEIRATFEEEFREHIARTSIKRIICACPNCMLALRNALGSDPRTEDIGLATLPQVLVKLGYRVDKATMARIIKGDESADVLVSPHDSCPDREYGEYADGLRDILPEGTWADPEHCRHKSVCCGSIPRAAGKMEAADKCADLNGKEALDIAADAIVTPCMSCAFQLNTAQKHVPVRHFLELLYDWPIAWEYTPQWMKVRFLFNDIMGCTELDSKVSREFATLDEADEQAAKDVRISNRDIAEIKL